MARLDHLTPAELREILDTRPAVLVPVGSIEWHDAHLPLGLDYLKIEKLCELIATEVGCVVAPPVTFGYAYHMTLDPTRALGTICPEFEALEAYVMAVGKALVDHGFTVVYFLSGHYERTQLFMLKLVARRLVNYAQARGRTVTCLAHHEPDFTIRQGISGNAREDYVRAWLGPEFKGGDHAGFYETSLALHLIPELVRADRIDPKYHDPKRGGPPSAEWGRIWTEMIVEKASAEIRAALAGRELVPVVD